jgi:hypothetical protein
MAQKKRILNKTALLLFDYDQKMGLEPVPVAHSCMNRHGTHRWDMTIFD